MSFMFFVLSRLPRATKSFSVAVFCDFFERCLDLKACAFDNCEKKQIVGERYKELIVSALNTIVNSAETQK